MYSPNSRQSDMQMPFTSSMGSITYPLSHDTISSYNNYPGKSPSAGSVFEQPFYPSLFQSELPPFFISYRWWEDEATTVLWAFDIQEIKRVIRFRLLTDDNLPRTALQSRNSSTVDNFLLTLAELHERPFVANLSHLQKAEEILRRCRIARPMLFPWSWFPSQYTAQLNDAQAVAGMIDAESHLHFTQIPFEDWVRYSLGYPSSAVEWFLQQHTVFHAHLLNHLDEHPEEIERYVEVEKHLRNCSPFAHRAVVQCLFTLQAGSEDMPVNSTPAFEFIATPIQQLFKDHPPSLSYILKVLSFLAIRFRRIYVQTQKMDWSRKFDTAIPFLEDLLMSTSAVDFARNLTSNDEDDFEKLSEQNVIAEDAVVRRLVAKWHMLSIEVWECCSALPDLISDIQECIQSLFIMQNYHSLTAILYGLQKYRISTLRQIPTSTNNTIAALEPLIPRELLLLMNPHRNYAAYRQHYQKAPGIPFLAPHIREFKEKGGEPVLHDLFEGMRGSMFMVR